MIPIYSPSIEKALREAVKRADNPGPENLHSMMSYHMGWQGDGAGPAATGKRIRPLLVLLTTQAAGGDWQRALPGAAAVELIHNFSLIHDDIEDDSPLRHGRPTLWTKWGIPQAINTGDAMFTLAHLALLGLEETTSPVITLQATTVLQRTCLRLTQGQHLDISFEEQKTIPIEAYWSMINGKTAALISACTEIGALAANAGDNIREAYRLFGHDLGLAFQVLDDILGIWGDAAKIGKSNASDLVTGKKSLPVIYGLGQNGDFARRWLAGPISHEEVPAMAAQLESEGVRDYAQGEANRLTDAALNALAQAHPTGEAGQALTQLANQLLQREV